MAKIGSSYDEGHTGELRSERKYQTGYSKMGATPAVLTSSLARSPGLIPAPAES